MGKETFSKNVVVTTHVDVTVDPEQFTPEFMAEFRKSFQNFDTVDEHVENIAQQFARGNIGSDNFIEGYGYVMVDGSYAYGKSMANNEPNTPEIDIKECDEDVEVEDY